MNSSLQTWLQRLLVLITLTFTLSGRADTLVWDANGTAAGAGGNGNWSGGNTWSNATALTTFAPWVDGNAAVINATSAITNNSSISVTAITNTGGNVAQIIGSGGNTIDFGAGGSFVSGGNTISLRSSAPFKGNVTLVPSSGALNQAVAIWLKANNTLLTNTTIAGAALASVIVDDAGALGTASSTVLVTNGSILVLGALTTEPVGSVGNNGSGGGLNMNAVPLTIGGGYIRSRAGSNTLNGPITITTAGSGFITRGVAGMALTLGSTATLNLNANTLNLNVDSTGDGVFINSAISGAGGGLQTVGTATVTLGANGTGTTRLNAANTFSGTALTAPNLGTLALGNVNALQNATLDTGSASGSQQVTFVVAGNNTYNFGALTGSDALAIGANTISVGTKAVDTTFSAVISGTGGKLTKVGANILTLNAANSYDGLTTISSGTLALGASGSLAAGSSVSIASGATFDVSAQATYTHGASASLTASGTASTPAVIFGGSTVDLGSRPVTLNFTPDSFSGDANSPALSISQGALTINGGITVVNNGASVLGVGTYLLISQASGTVTGTPTLSGTVGGLGLAPGNSATIQVSGGNVELVVQAALPTTTTLYRTNSTPSTSAYGDTLQFGVTVSPGAATGTVELRDGGVAGTLVGSGTLSGGSVTITPADNALASGTHNNLVALYLGDISYQASSSAALSPAQSITNKFITVTGVTANSKFYDTTTTATLSGGSLVGVESGDTVTFIGAGTFVSAGPGTGIAVTSTSTLGGASFGNYTLTQPTGLSANIIASANWTNVLGGTWSTAGNWTNSLVGTGTNVTADFSQLDPTADIIVTNDVNRTIGNLIFGDADISTAAGWVLTNNTVTLAGTTPTVTVNTLGTGKQVTINSIVAGTSGLTKKGPGTLTLAGANTYTGGTVVSNGVINFNGDSGFGFSPVSATPGNIVLDGGGIALTTGNQTVAANRGFIVGANGGMVSNAVANAGNLSINGVITGPGALTIGSAALAGVILSAQNTYSGGSILSGPANSTIFNVISTVGSPGSLVSGPFGTNTVTFNGPGMRSTTGADTTNGNAIVAAADITFPSIGSEKTLTWEGPVTLSGGSRTFTVNIGATVAGKSLTVNSVIGDGGNAYNLTKAGTGLLVLSGNNTFSGGVTNSGGVLTVNNNGALGTGALTINSGATRIVVNDGFMVTNNITINGGGASLRGLIENSGAGNATLTNGVITINSTTAGGGHFASTGGGTLTIAEPVNSSVAVSLRTGTVIMSGGGSYTDANITGTGRLGANNGLSTSATVDLGLSGGATFDLAGYSQSLAGLTRKNPNSALITNSATGSDSTLTLTTLTTNFPGSITDSGVAGGRIALVVSGGSHTLSGASTYTGNTTISAGTLALVTGGSIGGTPLIAVNTNATLDVTGLGFALGGSQMLAGNGTILGDVTANGIIIPGSSIGTLTFSNNLTINGNLVCDVNKSHPQSNDVINVVGTLNNTGVGTLLVTNLGPALAVNDSFKLFSQAVVGGLGLTIVGPAGVTFTNNLEVDGSIAVLTVPGGPVIPTTPTNITFTASGGNLTIGWPSNYVGWILQSQTNLRSVGLKTNWFNVVGSDATNTMTFPVNKTDPTVFFRLARTNQP